jgi:hypothetical protein
VAGTPPVAATFLALAAHRLAFGVATLLTLLLFRSAPRTGAERPPGSPASARRWRSPRPAWAAPRW